MSRSLPGQATPPNGLVACSDVGSDQLRSGDVGKSSGKSCYARFLGWQAGKWKSGAACDGAFYELGSTISASQSLYARTADPAFARCLPHRQTEPDLAVRAYDLGAFRVFRKAFSRRARSPQASAASSLPSFRSEGRYAVTQTHSVAGRGIAPLRVRSRVGRLWNMWLIRSSVAPLKPRDGALVPAPAPSRLTALISSDRRGA
jgi:hypothetical protein